MSYAEIPQNPIPTITAKKPVAIMREGFAGKELRGQEMPSKHPAGSSMLVHERSGFVLQRDAGWPHVCFCHLLPPRLCSNGATQKIMTVYKFKA